jgi:epoxyqueuosine reductase
MVAASSRAPADDRRLLEAIGSLARRQGLLGPSIAAAAPPAEAARHLARWLEEGYHGEMAYMARLGTARADPIAWAAWSHSLAVFAEPYDWGERATSDPARAAISRYARGEDYHRILKAKLDILAAPLRAAGRRVLTFVDSSPLMEKALAAAGGLGWVGKNGNLLRAGCGSFFFLGGLATDAVWEPTPREEEQCGTCDLCLVSCPTGAFVSPGVVDARRCVSYLTIELKGAIPPALRPGIGNRVFGCDDCQDVCPWNDGTPTPADPAYRAREDRTGPPLLELARLTEEEFRRRFHRSPVRRARWRGFLRNVMVALGNWRHPKALPVLQQGLAHSEPLVRGHASWALGRTGSEAAREALRQWLRTEQEPRVRREIEAALLDGADTGGTGDPTAPDVASG